MSDQYPNTMIGLSFMVFIYEQEYNYKYVLIWTKLTVITFSLDESVLVTIMISIIGATAWLAILSQRVWQLEKNPLLEAVRDMHKQQIADLVRKLSDIKGL
jgi:hypothetical protein